MTYLAAFPIKATVRGIHGPFVPSVVWDPERGFYTPTTDTDYGCWWAVTDAGDVPVPTAVVEEMQAATGTGYAWQIDLTAAGPTDDERRAYWTREWDRIRGDLNAAAQRVAHGVPL